MHESVRNVLALFLLERLLLAFFLGRSGAGAAAAGFAIVKFSVLCSQFSVMLFQFAEN